MPVSAALVLVPLVMLAVLVIGVVLVAHGRRQRSAADAWWRTSVQTTGVVLSSRLVTFGRYNNDVVGHADPVIVPTVRFTLPSGQEVVAESTQAHNFTARNGHGVTVHYQPSDPTHPRVGTFNIAKANSWGMLAVGIGFIVTGLSGLAFFGLIGLLLWFARSGSS